MKLDYLFYNDDLPKGVKTIFVDGKKITREEFFKMKSEFLRKKNKTSTAKKVNHFKGFER